MVRTETFYKIIVDDEYQIYVDIIDDETIEQVLIRLKEEIGYSDEKIAELKAEMEQLKG